MGVSSLCTGSWTRSKGACCHLPTASSKPLHDIAACGAHISWQNDPAGIAHHVVAAPTHSQDRSDKYRKRGKVGESTLSIMGMLKSAVTHAFLAALWADVLIGGGPGLRQRAYTARHGLM